MPADYKELLAKARFQYDAADHLLKVTFPLVKDPKLLIGVLSNIFISMNAAMEAALQYEHQLKLIAKPTGSFRNKITTFRYRTAKRNKIPDPYIQLMVKLYEILELHKKSPVEFQRGNRFVICDDSYRLTAISLKDIKQHLEEAGDFVNRIEGIMRLS